MPDANNFSPARRGQTKNALELFIDLGLEPNYLV